MGAKSKPTLSLCMIVKDEEKFLGRCLESVKDVVDEMIVVDTGSKDRTVEIAESFGAKVFHHPWEGSFSKARNQSLQYATGEWILQIDADEELEQSDIPVIHEVIKSNQYNAISVALLNDTPEGWAKHYFQRIFRKGKAWYKGIVHNQLFFEGLQLNSEIRFYHWGYNLSREKMEAKYKRTGELLLKQIETDPSDPFAYQNHLRILRVRKQYEEGIRTGMKALEVCAERMTVIHRQMITYDLAYCMMLAGRDREGERVCREMLLEFPENMDIFFILGLSLFSQERFEEAIRVFKQFLRIKQKESKAPRHSDLIVDTYSFEHKAWGKIADCYYGLKDYESSRDAAEKAVSFRPGHAAHKVTLARALVSLGNAEKAEAALKKVAKENQLTPDFYSRWTALTKQFPEIGEQETIIREGIKKFPDSDELLSLLGYAIHKSSPDEAEKAWNKSLEINPSHIGAHSGLAKLYGQMNRLQELREKAGYILQKTHQDKVLKAVGGYCLHAGVYDLAVNMFSQYLSMVPNDIETLSDVATAYAKMGQYEAAFLGYKEALKKKPDNPQVLNNLQTLEKLLSQPKAIKPA